MFERVLDCPQCGHRFHYEHEGDVFPEFITCPECSTVSSRSEYHALVLCNGCRSKLKIPLSMLGEEGNVCPKCGAEIQADVLSHLTDAGTTIADFAVAAEKKRMLQDGEFFDKFQIVKLLGRGGMAEVYLAEHLLLKQKCALKLMQRSLDQEDNPVFIKRFVREAKLTHSLAHPNIVKVFDAGSDFQTGYLFLAMEYVEGKTLHDILCEKAMSEEELLEILRVISGALKEIEAAKIVHRDIKPSNIMYTNDGVYKLMDLGIAKMESNHQAGDMTLTMEQSTIGTPGYASPEQCQAAHTVDIRSDIFSLGATLYHVASGEIPFTGETPVAVILNTMQKEPVSLRELRPDLSHGFHELIEKMMKKKPSERFQNVDELIEAVDKVVSGKNLSSPVRRLGKVITEIATTFATRVDSEGTTKFFAFLQALFDTLGAVLKNVLFFLTFILKWLFGLLLVALVLLNFYYVYLRVAEKLEINYKQFWTEEIFGMKKAPGVQRRPAPAGKTSVDPRRQKLIDAARKSEELRNMHPLIPDPDRTLRPLRNFGENEYVQVVLNQPLEEKFLVQYDFEKFSPKFIGSTPAMFHDGLLEPSGPKSIYCSMPYRGNDHWTVSLNFSLYEQDSAAVFSFRGADVFVFQGTLRVAYSGYCVDTKIRIQPRKWLNLTLSVNRREGRLLLLSGNLLIGSYLFSNQAHVSIGMLRFNSMLLKQKFAGQIDYLAVSSQSIQVVPSFSGKRVPLAFSSERLPDGISLMTVNKSSGLQPKSTVQKTAPEKVEKSENTVTAAERKSVESTPAVSGGQYPPLSPWKKLPLDQNADIYVSLARSIENLALYKKTLEKWRSESVDVAPEIREKRKEILDAAADLAVKWQERINYMKQRNSRVRLALRRTYNQTQTGRVAEMCQKYLELTYYSNPPQNVVEEHGRKISQALSNSLVDPNLKIRKPVGRRGRSVNGKIEYSFVYSEPVPLLAALFSSHFGRIPRVGNALLKRYPDPANLAFSNTRFMPDEFMQYGLPAKCLPEAAASVFSFSRLRSDGSKWWRVLFFDGVEMNAEYLSRAVHAGNYSAVLMLLACGVDPNQWDLSGEPPFFKTYLRKDGERFRQLLRAAGASPALSSRDGRSVSDMVHVRSLLEKSNASDHQAVSSALSSRKVSVNLIGPEGESLLGTACLKRDVKMVKLLLDHGADPNLRNLYGANPVMSLILALRKELSETKGAYTPAVKDMTEIFRLMLAKGGDISEALRSSSMTGRTLNSSYYIYNIYYIRDMIFMHPKPDEFISALSGQWGQLPESAWKSLISSLLVSYSSKRNISDKHKLMILRECPRHILSGHFYRICFRMRLTPEFITAYLQSDSRLNGYMSGAQRSDRFWVSVGFGSHIRREPLLSLLIKTKQPLDVIEAALKAGAYDVCRHWKDAGGRRIEDYSRHEVKMLLRRYGSSGSSFSR